MNLDQIFISVQNIDSFIKQNMFGVCSNKKSIVNAESWLQDCRKDGMLKGIVTNPELFPNVCESLNKCDENVTLTKTIFYKTNGE